MTNNRCDTTVLTQPVVDLRSLASAFKVEGCDVVVANVVPLSRADIELANGQRPSGWQCV